MGLKQRTPSKRSIPVLVLALRDQTHFISFVTAFETTPFTISGYQNKNTIKTSKRTTDQEWQNLLERVKNMQKIQNADSLAGEGVAETEQKAAERNTKMSIKVANFTAIVE